MSRIVHNKCIGTRVDIEGRAYRVISFFYKHPSATSEDNWSVFRNGEEIFLVDKMTLAVMAEHECELMTREVDEHTKEPTIVSVGMKPISKEED